jgi:isoamylase
MMTTLLLSQGTPMILAGDEIGRSQHGNNNAYAQDNDISWINWDKQDDAFLEFCKKIIAFRKIHPILGQKRFLHSAARLVDGRPDIFWYQADGQPMGEDNWQDDERTFVAVELRTASGTPEYTPREVAIFAVFNTGNVDTVKLPEMPAGRNWMQHIDTSNPNAAPFPVANSIEIAANSVFVFVLEAD